MGWGPCKPPSQDFFTFFVCLNSDTYLFSIWIMIREGADGRKKKKTFYIAIYHNAQKNNTFKVYVIYNSSSLISSSELDEISSTKSSTTNCSRDFFDVTRLLYFFRLR